MKDYPGVKKSGIAVRMRPGGVIESVVRIGVDRPLHHEHEEFHEEWFDGLMEGITKISRSGQYDSVEVYQV